MSDDQEGYVRPATPDELAAWNARSVRGVEVSNKDGLVTVDKEFTTPKAEQTWEYARWHQREHRGYPNPECKICQLDKAVKQSVANPPPCKQCGYKLEQHLGPTRECPV